VQKFRLTNSTKQATPNSLLHELDLHPPEAVVNQFYTQYDFFIYLEQLPIQNGNWFLEVRFQKHKPLFLS
jgi:hypothetical protein